MTMQMFLLSCIFHETFNYYAINILKEREATYNHILKSINEKEEEIEQLNDDLDKTNNVILFFL